MYPKLTRDGNGGVFVAWQDVRSGNNRDIYAQSIDSSGNIRWQRNGVPVVTASGSQSDVQLVHDGVGGAILAWTDNRGADSETYVQRISADGQPVWSFNGIKAADGGALFISVVPNDAGGVLLAWNSLDGVNDDVAVQQIDSSGMRMWGDSGIQVTGRPAHVYPDDVMVMSDGRRGAIVLWGEGDRVYAQHVDSTGQILWPLNGVLLSDSTASCYGVAGSSDGGGGAIVSWHNIGKGTVAQRIDSSGNILWESGGVLLGNSSSGGAQRNISDGMGGAFIGHGIFVQHVNSNGEKLWEPTGVRFTNLPIPGNGSVQVKAPGGGMWNFWTGYPSVTQTYGQWIDGFGVVRWGLEGLPITAIESALPSATDNGNGSAFVCWEQYANGYTSVYLAKVDTSGVTSIDEVPDSGIPIDPILYQNYPNPFNPTTTINYFVPYRSFVSIKLYDILGREMRTIVAETMEQGNHRVDLSLEAYASGTYFYRMISGSFTAAKCMVLVR